MLSPSSQIIPVVATNTGQPAGLNLDGQWSLRLFGRGDSPMGLDGAVNQIVPLLQYARTHPACSFRLDPISFANLPGRYYAPFFRAAPDNLILPEAWLSWCHRITQPIRLLVAGSRDYEAFDVLSRFLDHITARMGKTQLVVISGKAKGADTWGERWAKVNNVAVAEFPALWEDTEAPRARVKTGHYGAYNPRAGTDRNAWMAANTTHAVLFPSNPNQISRGTNNMLSLLQRFGIPRRVCRW